MPRLEELANVALRVPSILVLDLLYKCDIEGLTEHLKAKNEDMLFKYKYVIWNMYYIGHLINVVVLVLPLRHIVTLYLHILAALLLYMGHQISKDYVREELQYGYEGAVYLDSLAFNRFVSAMTSQIILSTLCAFLMKTRKVWLFSAHMLPLLARLCAAPHATLLTVNTFSMGLTAAGIAVFLLSNLFVPYRLARAAYSELLHLEVIELYRLLAVGISLWNQFAVPVLFSVFWFVLFVVQLCSDTMSASASAAHQGIMFFLLTSVSECCATPYSLLGLTFVVSYLALGLLNLCKFYLGGYAAVQNENVMHRGVTEGVTLLLLALQTGLLDMQALQRTFLLSIILFIVVTSTLQSMIEITDPVILALGASRNRSLWKHFRGLSMCLLLLVFPVFMAYKISQFFHMDFWLLILVSSCMLTSLQVTGTMLIYSLFMVELFRSDPIESLDEVIYWVNAVSRVLEFVVALCVVAYGTWESLFGEWSWMGASVIIIHSYFNVWLRAQSGWRSFLLRQEAAKKINSLPRATAQQLQQHNDVCSICFQEMSSAVITYCGHFFHGNCLRKWLYVQETCPMCHQTVRPTPPAQSQQASGDAPAAPPQRDAGPDPAAQQGVQDPDSGGGGGRTQESDDLPPDATKQQQHREEEESENKEQPAEPHSDAVHGLRFSSSGDFVGFVSPVSSGSGSHEPPGKTSHNQDERVKDSPLPSTPEAVSENAADSDSTGLQDSVALRSKLWIDPPESNHTDKKQEACALSLPGSQTSIKSCSQNSELSDHHHSHKGNGTLSDSERLRAAESAAQVLQPSPSDATFSCTSTDSSD
ncbi:RING finger protein 145 [Stegastes partitus]|uniref:RING finger protein 145 n=1 Tax=Stegastes partitus TaxID=144197 RepID=A0A3B4ZN58_9TELE|nr:PREDICTED: RING finger protein 145-like [Stegastes partitus]XP_008296505.1 PREDICTED: RING finger protein 145-like [Stegastes partitus]XP_008296506.1 PREDICTED: RING finger protein 145-like [Stegastes partitus]